MAQFFKKNKSIMDELLRTYLEEGNAMSGRFPIQIIKASKLHYRGAAIAQWIHLRLPSCCPWFESQAHHLCFYQIIFELLHVEKTKINKKRPGSTHFLEKLQICSFLHRYSQKCSLQCSALSL